MNSLTIYRDDNAGFTAISNRFIDEYLVEANDAQIKVYLYLVRMMSANLPTGISDMADKFNHTEKDIMRSLKYWEKKRLLSLEFNDKNNLTGIRFLTPSENVNAEPRPLAPIVPLKLVTSSEDSVSSINKEALKEDKAVVNSSVKEGKPVKDYSNISYSRDQLKAFKDDSTTAQILFVAEAYLQKTLSLSDIETLLFFHEELKFSPELIDYLLQYCVEKGKKQFSYIKTVAIAWSEAGITTARKAKEYSKNHYDNEVYAILKLLGRSNAPTKAEADFTIKWYKSYGFSMDIISEACNRTVLATDAHRLEYCDKILSSWHDKGVKTLEDVSKADSSYARKPKPSAQGSSSSKSSFNQMIKTDYDFDEIERQILSN